MMKTVYIIMLFAFVNYTNAQKMTQEEYAATAKYIWQNFVPTSGQAEFVQGELLRAIEKLRDEAHRNGNGNFHKKYLGRKLSEDKVVDWYAFYGNGIKHKKNDTLKC